MVSVLDFTKVEEESCFGPRYMRPSLDFSRAGRSVSDFGHCGNGRLKVFICFISRPEVLKARRSEVVFSCANVVFRTACTRYMLQDTEIFFENLDVLLIMQRAQ